LDDNNQIADAVRTILGAIGEDPDRDGLKDTPERVARMYAEVFGGLKEDPGVVLSTTFDQPHDEMIIVRDIPFYSMCEHHLMPFAGRADVAYIPSDRVVGLSKIARLVDILSRRPQIQERLTCLIADYIEDVLEPRGVAARVEAEHMCMTMRGIKKPGSVMVTTVTRGAFRSNDATRAEFFSVIGSRR
jgi:GTP cyclohydrolase IA